MAIVRSILEAEQNSLLNFDRSNVYNKIDYSSLNDTWYSPFFKLLREKCGKDDLKERFQSIALIVFNYDRCIEHFMYHALQNYYGITGDEAAELVNNMNIYHPYGSVGSLPWSGNGDPMEYGFEPSPEKLFQLSGKIKTFTEGTDPNSSDILEIKKHMGEAQRFLFLGFAFHDLNMELIKPDETAGSYASQQKCYATTYGFSESDKKAIQLQINRLHPGTLVEIGMAEKTCAAFFKEFSKSLAF